MTASTPPSAIEVDRLSFSYGAETVLQDVSFHIHANDFVCMVGPNGGGKTTLLRLILGLLTPAAGSLRVFGLPPEKARHRVGYMPQYVQLDLQFPVDVLDVVLMGRLGLAPAVGPYRKIDRVAALRALEEVGLSGMARRSFAELSGGQRQRALIARALACEPELLLLDEPTSNLDVVVQDDFYELLKTLSQRLTVVLVSHDVGFVSTLVRTVLCVNRRVSLHHTSELTGANIADLYESDVRMVQHHHDHSGHGHSH